MLKEIPDRDAVSKKIRVNTGLEPLNRLLESLLGIWGFTLLETADRNSVVLAEPGCVAPVDGQRVIWLTRSSVCPGADGLPLPLDLERLWQVLEQHFHQPPRRHIRMDLALDASVIIDDVESPTTLSSLSDMGCRFSYQRELVRDQPVRLSLLIEGESFQADSRVIYAVRRSSSFNHLYQVGLMFVGVDRSQRDRLRDFLLLRYLLMVKKEMDGTAFAGALDDIRLANSVREKLLQK